MSKCKVVDTTQMSKADAEEAMRRHAAGADPTHPAPPPPPPRDTQFTKGMRAAAGAATAAGALEALAFDDDDSTIGNFSAKFNATSEREGHDSAVCKLYKRTMTSYNAYEDAEFLRNYLGLELQATSTPSPVVAPCFHPPPPRVVLQRHGGCSPVRDSN